MAVLNCIGFGKKQGEHQNYWPIVTFKYFSTTDLVIHIKVTYLQL